MSTKLSIVVTTRNRKERLLKCLDYIRQTVPLGIPWELIVVDDASNDGTEHIRSADLVVPRGQIIHNSTQQMMACSRNRGARVAIGGLILFIDDDNRIDEQMIHHLIQAADRYPTYGILGPTMYFSHPPKKYLDYQLINFWTGKTTGVIAQEQREIYDSDGIPNVFLIRKKVFEAVGFFDESLIQTFTEPDFAFQAKRFGYKCAIVTAARTYHDLGLEPLYSPRYMGGTFVQKAYCLMRNRSVMVGRYASWYQKIIYGVCFSWVWPLVYSWFAFKHRRFDLIRLYWFGFFDGLIYLLTGKLSHPLFRFPPSSTA